MQVPAVGAQRRQTGLRSTQGGVHPAPPILPGLGNMKLAAEALSIIPQTHRSAFHLLATTPSLPVTAAPPPGAEVPSKAGPGFEHSEEQAAA
jgi:hypothetical protein